MDADYIINYTLLSLFSATAAILVVGLRVSRDNRFWRRTLDYVSLATGGVLLLETIYMALKRITLHG